MDLSFDTRLQKIEQALKDEGVEVRVHTKFFAPLENYLNITSNNLDEYTIKAQMYQTVRTVEKQKCYVFLFTNDYLIIKPYTCRQ